MTTVDSRTPFFPKTDSNQVKIQKLRSPVLKRNSSEKQDEISQNSAEHARVSIPEAVKDFSRIKKAVDIAPPVDNSAKIAQLKGEIQAGTYQIDYDALADKLLESEI